MRHPYHDKHSTAMTRRTRWSARATRCSTLRIRQSLQISSARAYFETAPVRAFHFDAQLVEAAVQGRIRRLETDRVAMPNITGDSLERLAYFGDVFRRER